jgi:hypothetical protein
MNKEQLIEKVKSFLKIAIEQPIFPFDEVRGLLLETNSALETLKDFERQQNIAVEKGANLLAKLEVAVLGMVPLVEPAAEVVEPVEKVTEEIAATEEVAV